MIEVSQNELSEMVGERPFRLKSLIGAGLGGMVTLRIDPEIITLDMRRRVARWLAQGWTDSAFWENITQSRLLYRLLTHRYGVRLHLSPKNKPIYIDMGLINPGAAEELLKIARAQLTQAEMLFNPINSNDGSMASIWSFKELKQRQEKLIGHMERRSAGDAYSVVTSSGDYAQFTPQRLWTKHLSKLGSTEIPEDAWTPMVEKILTREHQANTEMQSRCEQAARELCLPVLKKPRKTKMAK